MFSISILKQELKLVLVLVFLCSPLLFSNKVNAQTEVLPPFFTDQLISANWNQTEGFAFDANKRRYVWEKSGYVWIVDTNGVKQSTPLLNISEEVGNWGDHGLNGFALDPNFMTNGYFYCFYTVDRHYLLNYGTPLYRANKNEYSNATIARLVRFQADPSTGLNTLVPNSRTVLLGDNKTNGIPVLHTSHSTGTLLFGRDGSLLMSVGDGASFNGVDTGSSPVSYWYQGLIDSIITPQANVGSFRAQMLDSYNGKILRIDPLTGFGLPTNPFYDPAHPESVRSKVWCLGMRNPYKMSLTPGTGNTDISAGDPGVLIIGEVGWYTYEELNVSKHGGENFGWPIFEGLNTQAEYASPKYNQNAPNPLYNGTTCTQQFFTFQNLIKQATLDTSIHFVNPCNSNQLITTYPTFFQTRPQIEWKHNATQTRTGTFTGNNASVIAIDDPASPVKGTQFEGNASLGGTWYTDNRMPLDYQGKYFHIDYGAQWLKKVTFDNNFQATAIDSFANYQGRTVFLTVNPLDGCFNYIKYDVNEIHKICYTAFVNNPPVPVIVVNKKYGVSPLKVTFNGAGSYDRETKLNLSYLWKFGDGFTSIGKIAAHTYNVAAGVPTKFWASLKVTDSLGLSKTDSVLICVNDAPPVVNITSLNDSDFYSASQQTLLNMQAAVTDAYFPDSVLKYAWQVILYHNNHTHPGPIDSDKVTSEILDPAGCDGDVFWVGVNLKVTDPLGLSGYDTVRLFPACGPPIAYFKNTVDTICQGQYVQYIDSSTFTSAWEWIFQGGTPATSTLKSPLITYNTIGTFDVKLIVHNIEGTDTLIKTRITNVGGIPVTLSSSSDSICGAVTLPLVATSTAGSTYKWYKNGALLLNANAATFNTNTVGTFLVEATQLNGCKTTASKVIGQKQVAATISSNKSPLLCFADTITLSVDTPKNCSYRWKKGTTNIQGATGLSYKTIDAGTYSVTTNNGGCTAKSNSITVTLEPTFNNSANGPLTICNGDSVKLSITNPGGAYTYQWQNKNINIPGATSSSYIAKATGNYSANVITPSGCIKKGSTFKVAIDADTVTLASSADSICGTVPVTLTASAPAGSTFKWYLDGSIINAANAATYVATTAGTYNVASTKSNNCKSNAAKILNQRQIIVNAVSNKPALLCFGDTITLSVDTPKVCTYQWKKGSTDIAGATGLSYKTTGAGAYSVTTNNNGCTAKSNTITVTMEPVFTNVASGSLNICKGDSVTLSITNPGGAYTFQWQNKNVDITGATGANYIAKAEGTYSATVTTPSGCTSKGASYKVTFDTDTVKIYSATDSICGILPIVFTTTAPAGSVYSWYLNNSLISSATSSSYTAVSEGEYKVMITNTNNCKSSASKTLKQKQFSATISGNKSPLICLLDSITLSVDTPKSCSYQWKKGTANISGATGLNYTTASAGTYSVSTDNNGCVAKSNSITVAIDPSFTGQASGPLTICTGDSVTLSIQNQLAIYTYQWRNNNVAIAGATGSSYAAKIAGTYSVIVTNASGCSRQSANYNVIINCKLASNGLNPFVENLSLQPNPVSDKFNLTFDLIKSDNIVVSIYDVTGRQVYQETFTDLDGGENKLNIDASSFTDGVYEINLSSPGNADLNAQTKFLKSK